MRKSHIFLQFWYFQYSVHKYSCSLQAKRLPQLVLHTHFIINFFDISRRQKLRGCSVDLVVSRIFWDMFVKKYAGNKCHWNAADLGGKSANAAFLLVNIIYLKCSNDSADKLRSENFIRYFSACWEI